MLKSSWNTESPKKGNQASNYCLSAVCHEDRRTQFLSQCYCTQITLQRLPQLLLPAEGSFHIESFHSKEWLCWENLGEQALGILPPAQSSRVTSQARSFEPGSLLAAQGQALLAPRELAVSQAGTRAVSWDLRWQFCSWFQRVSSSMKSIPGRKWLYPQGW